MSAEIRSYMPSDLEAIQKIHEENNLGFEFPNIESSMFVVNKVLLTDDKVRASYALRLVAECNLWIDQSDWADAEAKWTAIKTLDREAMDAAKDIGLDSVQCFLPPKYKRFGKRISSPGGLGFTRDTSGWIGFGKFLGDKK
jgi:hypothetical protein